MRTLKNIIFSVIAIAAFFALLEGISRLFVFPGSYDYIERRIIEQGLSQKKEKGEIRIFLYGESTMQGSHLYPYSTIGKWLKLYLDDLLPEDIARRIRVVNLARLGEDSRFTVTAFRDTIPYKPDLAVFYMAHNDFCILTNRRQYLTRKSFKDMFEEFAGDLPRHSSFLNAINRVVIRAKLARKRAKDQKLKSIDSWYEEDKLPSIAKEDLLYPGSKEFEVIKRNFEDNINKAVEEAKRASIPVIFLEGVAKWKGYEPMVSVHTQSMTNEEMRRYTRIFAGASYDKCLEIDPAYALAYYREAQYREALGQFEEANRLYSLANDKDCFPIRAPSTVNRFYEGLDGLHMRGVYVIRTQRLFEENSPNGIIRDDLIGDQIHPTIEGQALIAMEIVKLLYDKDLIAPKASWRWRQLKGVSEMRKGLRLDKEAEFEICMAMAGYLKRDYTKAAIFLEEALKIRPGSINAESFLAWTYWRLGRKDRAIDLYRRLNQRAPSAAAVFFKKHADIRELFTGQKMSK